jgi:hypothetical protein
MMMGEHTGVGLQSDATEIMGVLYDYITSIKYINWY